MTSTEMEQKLYEKYPKLYQQKDLDKKDTCMCWGIQCPTTWYPILDALSHTITHYAQTNDLDIQATQVKEKFGTLRFYVNDRRNDYIAGAIDLAESMTARMCAACGQYKGDRPESHRGTVYNICKTCKLTWGKDEQVQTSTP